MCACLCALHGYIHMVDLFWIVAGIFITAIAISLILGKLHGTLAI